MGPLKDAVVSRLPWLLDDLGFRIAHSDYDYKAMGSSTVELESESMRLRFVRDRSFIQTQVAARSRPDGWMELGFLWYALTGVRPEPQLDGWAFFFRQHLPKLSQALGPNLADTLRAYERAEQESRETLKRQQERMRQRRLTLYGRLRAFNMTRAGLLLGPIIWMVAGGALVWLLSR